MTATLTSERPSSASSLASSPAGSPAGSPADSAAGSSARHSGCVSAGGTARHGGLAGSATAERIAQELDLARARGPLRQIKIPPCPELLVRLQAAMASADADLSEVARIAGSDVAMAATLLRNANGPLHAGGQPVHTVGQAMNRIGLKATAALLTAFLLRHAVAVHHPLLRRFWERSAMRAAAMHFLARRLPGLDPELAHLYGLFSHVGQPVLMQCVRSYGSTMVEAAARVDRPFVATENANHRTDHAVVGALVARTWHVTPTVVAAIRLHHDLDILGSQRVEPEVQTFVAAGLLAEHRVREREGLAVEADWVQHGPRALEWLGFGAGDLADWQDELEAELDAV